MIRVPFSEVVKFDYRPDSVYWGLIDGQVILGCQCGGLINLRGWSISPDGVVSPSVDHSRDPYHPCTFHNFITLDNYAEKIKGDSNA